jgi:phosphate transport system substrate-binding protein
VRIVVGHNAAASIDNELQQAFAAGAPQVPNEAVPCSDREAVELLLVGRADFGLIGGSLSPRETQAGMSQVRLGVELFAVSASPRSSVRSLTRAQLRQIFTAEVTTWQQFGLDGGDIVAIVPADRALADRAARALIPGDSFATSCVRAANRGEVAEHLRQNAGAVGIVRVTPSLRPSEHKLLQVDWCPPTAEAFGYGTYPFGVPLQLITPGQPTDTALRFLEFARSDAGRKLLSRTLCPAP